MRRAWLSCIVLVAAVAAACSSGSSATKNAASKTTTTAATSTSGATSIPVTTVVTASTCGATTPGGTATGGKADAAPPGDIPDSVAYVAHPSATGHYTIKAPEGWAQSNQGSVTVFSDKLNSIRIEIVPVPAAPSVATVQAQDLPALKSQSRCFEGGAVTTAARKSGTAVLVTYKADGPADPVTGKVVHDDVERYAFWNAGTEAIVTLSSPQGSDNVDPWRTVTDSFAWT